MIKTAEELYKERWQLICDTIELKSTSRVPNCTRFDTWPYMEYGITRAQARRDYEKAAECYRRFFREFSPDVGSLDGFTYPARAYELLGMKNVRWPGDPKGLDENAPYQFIEYATMEEDEYDEYLNTPIEFVIGKYLGRVATLFEPLTKLNYPMMATHVTEYVSEFTKPEMLKMYDTLKECASEIAAYRKYKGDLVKEIEAMGFPFLSGGGSATAFDMLGDYMRGTFGMMPDLMEQPENVKRTLSRFVKYHIEHSLTISKATGSKFAWVMLHKGFDNFIGDNTYREFYWPYLQEWINAMVDNGITPIVFCEGSYTTRLKYLADVPENKVVYLFEEVDLKEAKRILGGHCCIMGGFPIYTLTNGTVDQVKDKVKEVLDIMAPGGGYLFSTSCCIDYGPRANIEAMFETLELYGKY